MNYQKITSPDINNGTGCRVTLWVSGCPNRCPGCHNSETWDRMSGINFDDEAFSKLFELLEKSYIKGLTLSGGEPLDLNDSDKLLTILNILKKFRDRFGYSGEKDVWIFTGNSLVSDLNENETAREILKYVDYVVDGRYDESQRDTSLAFRGSRNQIIWKKDIYRGSFYPDEKLMGTDRQ